jgi:hypothetical protein
VRAAPPPRNIAKFIRKTVSTFALSRAAEHVVTGIDKLMKRAIPDARRNACDDNRG